MTDMLSRRAAFLCRNEGFQRWLDRKCGLEDRTTDEDRAARWLRRELGIASRSQIKTGSTVGRHFEQIEKTYRSEVVEMGFDD